MEQRISMVPAWKTHFWSDMIGYKTWSTSSFASDDTGTMFLRIMLLCFLQVGVVAQDQRYLRFCVQEPR